MQIRLDQPMVIQLSGTDASKILHNLTTNNIQPLDVGAAIETFVTDVRGWVVAHGLVYRSTAEQWWLLGQHPDSSVVCNHIDRYIIRESVIVQDLSSSHTLTASLGSSRETTSVEADQHRVPFQALGKDAWLLVSNASATSSVQPVSENSLDVWQWERLAHFWPRLPIDMPEKCIPQELVRNAQAISFTKGCYLGQETIARLDARGQIQRKLSLLSLSQPVQERAVVVDAEKEVGYITSTASRGDQHLALAILRRGYFEIGQRLTCNGLPVRVIAPPAL